MLINKQRSSIVGVRCAFRTSQQLNIIVSRNRDIIVVMSIEYGRKFTLESTPPIATCDFESLETVCTGLF